MTKKEWIIMHCLDAFKNSDGEAGEHKVPLEGFDKPMTKEIALKTLEKIEQNRPNEDFSIRKIAPVIDINPKTP